MPPAKLSPLFLSNPTAGEFLSHKLQKAAFFSSPTPLCWRLSSLRQRRHPRSPPGKAGARNSSPGLAGSREQLGQPRERRGGREDRGDQNRHVHVFSLRDNFSSMSCQRNTQSGYLRAPLLRRDRLGDNVGQQRGSLQAGICPRRETLVLHSGCKGISSDLDGFVFQWVGGKGGKEHRLLCAGLKPQLELLEQGEKSFPRFP